MDLEGLCHNLLATAPELEEVWLFGSRQQKSGSKRSDIDVLVRLRSEIQLDLIDVQSIRRLEPYLDCFSVTGGTALSAANGSQITADSWEALRLLLKPVLIWSKGIWVGNDQWRLHEVIATYTPAMTIAELGQLRDPARPQFDAIVLSALREEYAACTQVFRATLGRRSQTAIATVKHAGSPDPGLVVRLVCIGRMGSIESAIAATKWMMESPASCVFLVGIAAGIRNEVELGDIVVPRAVYDYEPARATAAGQEPDMTVYNVNRDLHAQAQGIAPSFRPSDVALGLLPPKAGRARDVVVHTDVLMASGAKVVADAALADEVTKWNRKASAIEMEAAGVAAAAEAVGGGSPFLAVKAVSDFADADKGDDWHPFASRVAAEFVLELLSKGLPNYP